MSNDKSLTHLVCLTRIRCFLIFLKGVSPWPLAIEALVTTTQNAQITARTALKLFDQSKQCFPKFPKGAIL